MIRGKSKGMAGVLSVVAALFLLVTAGAAQGQPNITAELKAVPEGDTGQCPVLIKFNGKITVAGVTEPVKVTYQFIRSDKGSGPERTLTFNKDGSKSVGTSWKVVRSGWIAIKVIDPQQIESDKAEFTVDCKAGAAPSQQTAPKQKAAQGKPPRKIKEDGRFIAYDNGTVLDTRTNLIWAAKDNGSDINWKDAKAHCENYRGGGYTDWRLPTTEELAGLYDESKNKSESVAVHLTKLILLSACCPWTSETFDSQANLIVFHNGHWANKTRTESLYMRALPVCSGNAKQIDRSIDPVAVKETQDEDAKLNKRKEYARYISDLVRQRDNGNYDEALNSVNKAIELFPESIMLYTFKGGIYLRKNDLQNAKKAYEFGLKLNKVDTDVDTKDHQYNYAAICAIMLGKFKDAEAYLKVIPKSGSTWGISITLGHAYLFQNKTEEAIKAYRVALNDYSGKQDLRMYISKEFKVYILRYPEKEPLIKWVKKELALPE